MEQLPELDRAQLQAIDRLRAGAAVVVTWPGPMPYGGVASDPDALIWHSHDGRLGISVHSAGAREKLYRYLDLPDDALAAVDFALAERVSVLAPIRLDPTMPEWLAPAIADGRVLFFNGSWGPLALLWESFSYLYGVAVADRASAPGTVIVDADHLREQASYGIGTTVRVDREGQLSIDRTGHAADVDVLLDRLREFASEMAPQDAGPTPLGKAYLSTAVLEGRESRELVPGTRIQLEFERVPNQNADGPRVYDVVRAHAGRNRMTVAVAAGQLLIQGTLHIDGFGGTAIRSQPPLRDQEEWLKAFLMSRPSWRLNGDELTLNADGTTITLLDRRIAEPDLPLDGTRWKVAATITNADLRHYHHRAAEAWLMFQGDRLTAWTGHNRLTATVTRTNTQLTFTAVTRTTHPCPPGSAPVEAAIIATVGTTVTYTRTQNTLTLLTRAGLGLTLRAP
ncbi:META domain-containing protein [Kribbella sp. NPDC048915]|uniref:META domain-containing protein n=1 Tax=Kribbella sp. NPDC048915 TaxID=3155148 RepID=UPI00340961F4